MLSKARFTALVAGDGWLEKDDNLLVFGSRPRAEELLGLGPVGNGGWGIVRHGKRRMPCGTTVALPEIAA